MNTISFFVRCFSLLEVTLIHSCSLYEIFTILCLSSVLENQPENSKACFSFREYISTIESNSLETITPFKELVCG